MNSRPPSVTLARPPFDTPFFVASADTNLDPPDFFSIESETSKEVKDYSSPEIEAKIEAGFSSEVEILLNEARKRFSPPAPCTNGICKDEYLDGFQSSGESSLDKFFSLEPWTPPSYSTKADLFEPAASSWIGTSSPSRSFFTWPGSLASTLTPKSSPGFPRRYNSHELKNIEIASLNESPGYLTPVPGLYAHPGRRNQSSSSLKFESAYTRSIAESFTCTPDPSNSANSSIHFESCCKNKAILSPRSGVGKQNLRSLEGDKTVRLFIGRIPKSYRSEDLRKLLKPFGPLLECNIVRDKVSGTSKGCGLARLASLEKARRAIATLNQRLLLDPTTGAVQVKFATGELERLNLPLELQPGGECVKVFFGNLAPTTTESEMVGLFKRFGDFEELCILKDKNQNTKCFVTFRSREFAEASIKALDGIYRVAGSSRPLEVRFAKSKKQKAAAAAQAAVVAAAATTTPAVHSNWGNCLLSTSG